MMMGLGVIGMILFLGVLVFLAVWLVRSTFQFNRESTGNTTKGDLSARQILEQRYARGEINREQYQIMLKDIQ